MKVSVGDTLDQRKLMTKLVELQYQRNDQNFYRGSFRVRGDLVELFPSAL